MQNQKSQKWLTDHQVVEKTGIPRQTLANLRCQGKGPIFYKIGRSIRYKEQDIENYMESHRVIPYSGKHNEMEIHDQI
jgi:predicted DNA-binding transcriptional regulator AlpA